MSDFIRAGQIYKWGEMFEDEFGRQTFETSYARIEEVDGNYLKYRKGSHPGNLGAVIDMFINSFKDEIKKGRAVLVVDSYMPVSKMTSRLEGIDCD